MGQDWVSQTRACAIYGLTVADLQDNVATVIDKTTKAERTAGNGTGNAVKVAKYPRVPLTTLLVNNTRGYRLPMRLYKKSELEKLSALKKAERLSQIPQKKVTKKVKPRKKVIKPIVETDPPCLSAGHNIETDPNGVASCLTCGQRIEIEEI